MKRHIIPFIPAAGAVILLIACSREYNDPAATGGELTFTPTVAPLTDGSDPEMAPRAATRAIVSDFFQPGFGIDITITSSNPAAVREKFVYTYGTDGVFRGNPGYHFKLDDNYISTLEARWPQSGIRTQPFATDQRTLENHLLADWMTATSSATGIVPTDKPVPLTFVRENALLEFVIAGQNTEGGDIKQLLIELHPSSGSAKAYWAYCELSNGHAQLILPAGTHISSPNEYMIGTMTVEGSDDNYTIIFPEMDLELQAGTRYLATLTPRGFYMDIFISVLGFNQGDGGAAVPFAPPVPDNTGTFRISTGVQLVTMSYLMRHYEHGATFDWLSRNYVLDDGLTVDDNVASRYVPIPKDSFSGTIKNTSGTDVVSITYGGGELQLYDR